MRFLAVTAGRFSRALLSARCWLSGGRAGRIPARSRPQMAPILAASPCRAGRNGGVQWPGLRRWGAVRARNAGAVRFSAFLVATLVASCGLGAYLDHEPQGREGAHQPAGHVLPPPRPVPPPQHPAAEVVGFVGRLRVLPPQESRGLMVFPLALTSTQGGHRYRSLDDALRRGWLDIRDSGRVEEVRVRNRSRDLIFMMAGEALAGGKQNRMVREDVLVWPHSREVLVPTYCVEHGRWSEGSVFGAAGYLSSRVLRTEVKRGASQDAVWEHIRREADRFSVRPGTEDLGAIVASERVRPGLQAIRRGFGGLWVGRLVGLVAADASGILGMDAFCDWRLFADLRDKLVDSYAMAVLSRPAERPGRIRREDVERFLRRFQHSRFRHTTTPGAGVGVDCRGPGLDGRVLLYQGSVVHLEASPLLETRRPGWGGREDP